MSYRDFRSDSRSSSDVLRGPAGSNDRRVYVGNLPPDVRENEIKDIFEKYGDILDVDLKTRRDSHFGRGSGGSPFCFVEFQDRLAAEDAVERRDGYNYDGYKLRVEFPRGGGRGGFSRGFDRGGGGGRGRGPPRRSSYKIRVEGLPPTGSWQDLKDHMREAGEVCYADVDKNGGGVVEFVHREDMSYAIKNLDDTKFKSHENETSYIKLSKDGGRSYSRSRSRSPRRSSRRSYTRSRSRSRD